MPKKEVLAAKLAVIDARLDAADDAQELFAPHVGFIRCPTPKGTRMVANLLRNLLGYRKTCGAGRRFIAAYEQCYLATYPRRFETERRKAESEHRRHNWRDAYA